LPLTLFVGGQRSSGVARLGPTLPAIVVPALTYAERLAHWQQALPSAGPALPELARRFRYEQTAIARVGRELAALGHPPTAGQMLSAARATSTRHAGASGDPRFALGELMLPAIQAGQIDEIVAAVNNLTRVHYEWGTARAWNEAGWPRSSPGRRAPAKRWRPRRSPRS